MPTLLSIQVGKPRRNGVVGSHDPLERPFQSGIFKFPVAGPVWLGTLNLAGDGQADLQNHGGPFRAALMYGADHYPVWREELAMPDLPYGAFGENLTVSELTEDTVCIGDIYDLGEAQIQVTQPRQPCWKLARRWRMKELTARVAEKGWGGWYCRVLREGYLDRGVLVTRLERPFPQLTIAHVNSLIHQRVNDAQAAAALVECEALTPEWREVFAARLLKEKD